VECGQCAQGARKFPHLVIQLDAVSATPVLGTPLASSAVHEDLTPSLGRGGEELAAAVEVWPRAVADQAQVGFVHQRRRFDRRTGLLSGHLLGRQLAQLVVDQRQELLRGARRLARWRTGYA